MSFFIKRLRVLIASDWDIWNNIAIIVIIDLLHNNFSITTENILEWGNKTINEIQLIFASTKAKFISKRARRVIEDLAMMSKSRNSAKQKVNS